MEKTEVVKKKNPWILPAVIVAALVLSGFMYYKTEILLTSIVFQAISWVLLIGSFAAFLCRKQMRDYFHEEIYSAREYQVLYNNYLARLDEKARIKDRGMEKPLRDFLFSLKLYPALNAVFFLLETVINRMGYTWLTAPLGLLFFGLQFYCAYKVVAAIIHQIQVKKVFKDGKLVL